MRPRSRLLTVAVLAAALLSASASTQVASPITSPRQQFGFDIGDDYMLATYSQVEEYWKTLARESDRMSIRDIGATEEGRRQWMALVSAPENLADLDKYQVSCDQPCGR